MWGGDLPDNRQWGRIVSEGKATGALFQSRTLAKWGGDPESAGLRDPDALDRLSSAERQECRALWSGLDAVLAQARVQFAR
jgi:hypothetical protein